MKIFCCHQCNELFSLSHEYKECKGKHGGGMYIDNLNAKVWGEKDRYSVLGIDNGSFVAAIREQIKNGDSTEMMYYAGGMTPKGREFDAFIIPTAAKSVIRLDKRFDSSKND